MGQNRPPEPLSSDNFTVTMRSAYGDTWQWEGVSQENARALQSLLEHVRVLFTFSGGHVPDLAGSSERDKTVRAWFNDLDKISGD